MTRPKVRLALAGACLLALTATACSSDSKSSNAATVAPVAAGTDTAAPAAVGSPALTISGSKFGPASVIAGTPFTITNNDSVAHTVTADDGSFSVPVPAGGTAPLKIDKAGSYAIHCTIHSSMHGTITVA